MPDLDVSPALESAMLSDEFTVLRRSNATNVQGRVGVGAGPIVIATYQTYGTVLPTSRNDLDRLTDEQMQHKSIKIITEFTLQGAATATGQQQAPDNIIYNGNTYQVADLNDFTQWGMSFTDAVCIMIDAQPVQQPAQDYQPITDL
jgi:hypothetical protein